MTEDEARLKWCPFVRTGLTAGMAVNRHVADQQGAIDGVWNETRCIASECMMWQWIHWTGARGGQCGLASIKHA